MTRRSRRVGAVLAFLGGCVAAAQDGPSKGQPDASPKPLLAGLLIEDGVFNTELTAPMDIFHHSPFHAQPGVAVCTIARSLNPVRTYEGLVVTPDHSYANAPELDILVVPSAERHVSADFDDPELIGFVKERAPRAQYVMSLCDGAFVLAKAGLLDDRYCTTYPGDIKALRERYPRAHVVDAVSFVVDGDLITGAGGARSFEPALYLVERLHGRKPAQGVARGMVIDWDLRRVPHYVHQAWRKSYTVGDRIDPGVTIWQRDLSQTRLLDLLEDEQLLVLYVFGGGDATGKARRAGLWCEDSMNELSLIRHMMARYREQPVLFVGVACPPIHDEELFGYPSGSFVGGDEGAWRKLVTTTEQAIDTGVLPFEDVYFDFRFRLLHNIKEHPRRDDEPEWLGRFRFDTDYQRYGTPAIWMLSREGEVMATPFFGNNYETNRALRYTDREVDAAIATALETLKDR